MLPFRNGLVVVVFNPVHSNARCPRLQGFNDVVLLAKRLFCSGVAEALHLRPAVVSTGFNDVEFIIGILPMLAGIDDAVGTQCQALAVAVSEGVDVRIGEGVVVRNASVQVQSQCLALQRIHRLGKSR